MVTVSLHVGSSDCEEIHEYGTRCLFAGLTLGVQAPPPVAPEVLWDLEQSLTAMVKDSAYGYPGLFP